MTDHRLRARDLAGRHIRTEFDRCRSELTRLRDLRVASLPVVTAVGWSVSAVVLGNAVVVAERVFGRPEVITLLGVPAMGLVGATVLVRRGWSGRELGFRKLTIDTPTGFPRYVLWPALLVAGALGTAGLIMGGGQTRLEVVRLLIATAAGEEAIHRGVVLGAWLSTDVKGRWIVAANMVTFSLWHVASACHDSGFRWWELVGPGVIAPLFLWARLRFRSIVAPTVIHAAINMPGVVLGMK